MAILIHTVNGIALFIPTYPLSPTNQITSIRLCNNLMPSNPPTISCHYRPSTQAGKTRHCEYYYKHRVMSMHTTVNRERVAVSRQLLTKQRCMCVCVCVCVRNYNFRRLHSYKDGGQTHTQILE